MTREVRERQAAYIRKVIDTLNDLDNVLYEVTNEGGNKDWDRFVVDTVHAYEKTEAQAAPGGPHRPRLGEQRRDARQSRRLVFPRLAASGPT